MNDKIEKLGSSTIQHGKSSDRIYLMKLAESDLPEILEELNDLAANEGYTKIFAKTNARVKDVFLTDGYLEEAFVPGFYNGQEDGSFLGKFLSPERQANHEADTIKAVLEAAESSKDIQKTQNDKGLSIRKAGPADIADMANVYKRVFESYPFPIHDPQYLLSTMKSHISYYVTTEKGNIVAVSSAETDPVASNVEMTDFATLPEYRKRGIATKMLTYMDRAMSENGFKTAYTIARAVSFGMNITFARNGYTFAGTLLNNTNIAGSIESMNVWYNAL